MRKMDNTPRRILAADRLAKMIAADEGYTWQLCPTAAQARKQDRYVRRARRYVDFVMEKLNP